MADLTPPEPGDVCACGHRWLEHRDGATAAETPCEGEVFVDRHPVRWLRAVRTCECERFTLWYRRPGSGDA